MSDNYKNRGVIIASLVVILWIGHLLYGLLEVEIAADNPWVYLHILVQTHLFTGLFITGHDGMHGTIKPHSPVINKVFGTAASFLYAGLSFTKLKKNHQKHHNHPGTPEDPDYCERSQNFFVWYFTFMWRYLTIWQILVMAVLFNVLGVWFSESRLILLWIVPAFLSTFQMFYFGVYAPHKQPHLNQMMPYRSRTMNKNHIWAFLSCWFFGYHYEHHQSPWTPWWKLHAVKK
ncbi:fatty acid desaturase [Marinilabilia rubra]|uniref:Fatty acid desaturase n=1 Tax=Marinilabilia rubra TaxID=2162893 RepID=A0A2U2B877_9BACT|nr:fatty acid desaturase [Marinilabilia rubra]PWD99252.1 fatty acid desaturase [Marinilabilia rubra]